MVKLKRIFLLISMMMFIIIISSCTSQAEKQQAKENVKKAESLLKEHLNEEYGALFVWDLKTVMRMGGSILPSNYATDCVRCKFLVGVTEYEAIIDLETGKVYDNCNKADITKSIGEYVLGTLELDEKPYEVEIQYVGKDIYADVSTEGFGFAESQISSMDQLLDNYNITVIIKYIDSDMNFDDINMDILYDNESSSGLDVAVVNYVDESRYDKDVLGKVTDFYFNTYEYFWKMKNIIAAEGIMSGEDDLETDYTNHIVERYDIVHNVYNDIEFAYNRKEYSIMFSREKAEDGVTLEAYKYEGKVLHPVEEDSIILDVMWAADDEHNSHIYMFYENDSVKDEVLKQCTREGIAENYRICSVYDAYTIDKDYSSLMDIKTGEKWVIGIYSDYEYEIQ